MAEAISQESNLAPKDAHRKFYALSDEVMARSLQEEEFSGARQQNQMLRQRVRSERELLVTDANAARNLVMLEEDREMAARIRQLEMQDKAAEEEQDALLAERLQKQLSTEGVSMEDEKLARMLQDEDCAKFLEEKEKRKQEKIRLRKEQQRLLDEKEAQRLLKEEEQRAKDGNTMDADQELARLLLQQEMEEKRRSEAAAAADQKIAHKLQHQEVQEYKQVMQSRAAAERGPVARQQSTPSFPSQSTTSPTGAQPQPSMHSMPPGSVAGAGRVPTRSASAHAPKSAQTAPPPAQTNIAAVDSETPRPVPVMGKRRVAGKAKK